MVTKKPLLSTRPATITLASGSAHPHPKNIIRSAAAIAPTEPSISLMTCRYAPRMFRLVLVSLPRIIIHATNILIKRPIALIISIPVVATCGGLAKRSIAS
ncbi:hypothetical protein D3C78_1501440 [compost metagenome]